LDHRHVIETAISQDEHSLVYCTLKKQSKVDPRQWRQFDQYGLVGVLYRSLHRDQQGKKGSLFPEAKQIQKGGIFSVRK
jgi:hypothetical protein